MSEEVRRATASSLYDQPTGPSLLWSGRLATGRNDKIEIFRLMKTLRQKTQEETAPPLVYSFTEENLVKVGEGGGGRGGDASSGSGRDSRHQKKDPSFLDFPRVERFNYTNSFFVSRRRRLEESFQCCFPLEAREGVVV